MGKVISISNHKGGVGKTTSAINIGAGLNRLGEKVLLIDLDPQANLSQSLGLTDPARTIYGALRGEYKLQPIQITQGLDIVPSTLDLSGAEDYLSLCKEIRERSKPRKRRSLTPPPTAPVTKPK